MGGAVRGASLRSGAVTVVGSCSNDQQIASYCDNGVLRRDPCGAGEICGVDNGNRRCISVDDNACGDVSFFGACDGDTLTWCDSSSGAGVVRTRDCAACGGQACLLQDNVVGFACVDNPCGDLTFEGECDGTVARWCDDHVVQTQDCADSGEVCGFVDDDTGFFCK